MFNLQAICDEKMQSDLSGAALFSSPALNRSIIIKHRMRADDLDLMPGQRTVCTKVIVPFDARDLRAGGKSLLIGQHNYLETLRDVGQYHGKHDIERDIRILKFLDDIPSLDPFLLREKLRSNGINPDPRYFSISPGDQQRMFDYTAGELDRLTGLAGGSENATGKMVGALLSNDVDEKLEPLRLTLSLSEEEFREGVFSWRGFIYYKWCLDESWPNLIRALRGIKAIMPIGKITSDERALLESSKNVILRGAKANSMEIRRIIAIYDDAYAGLIERQDPKLFREFLLGAPKLFLDIGDRMGAISHITSFWNYRFPAGAPRSAYADELIAIFQDFSRGMAAEFAEAA